MKQEEMNSTALDRRLAGELPTIDVAGDSFVIDLQRNELRLLSDPHKRLDLGKMDLSSDGKQYLCFYHLPTKSMVEIGQDIVKLPKDTVALQLPNELQLDPVGAARKYGWADTELLQRYPLIENFKAMVVSLQETGLPELVRRNKEKQSRRKAKGKRKGKGLQ